MGLTSKARGPKIGQRLLHISTGKGQKIARRLIIGLPAPMLQNIDVEEILYQEISSKNLILNEDRPIRNTFSA